MVSPLTGSVRLFTRVVASSLARIEWVQERSEGKLFKDVPYFSEPKSELFAV
ncbi:hypothetical protein GOAMI_63_00010 [Gordonia amicalis NBRC 100051 = JCM 11271]|nr:hypothetical protein GOAMI_63_00010 [Gordonia amicalis NBRC 100051 = JCM 11271]